MDSSPPFHRSESCSRTKSASRLSRIRETDRRILSRDIFQSTSPKGTPPSAPISSECLPIRDLILLSSSPVAGSKTSSSDGREIAEDAPNSSMLKARVSQIGLIDFRSPRKRRNRVRAGTEELGVSKELVKPRKRRHSGRWKKNKPSLTPLLSSSIPLHQSSMEEININYDRLWELVIDLIMWKDVARSGLWFGLGCLFILSSSFPRELSFSAFSTISRLGLLFLALSFFSNSYFQRDRSEKWNEFKLKEEDMLKIMRALLPPANLALSKAKGLFSGEASMTLKVAPLLLIGAEYGHLLTFWRLFSAGFFLTFTVPKLYTSYAPQIMKQGKVLKARMMLSWENCSHKKIVVVSAVTAFWNLSSARTRVFAVFVSLVVLRYHQQFPVADVETRNEEERGEPLEGHQEEQALDLVTMK